jgi:hypothetical protein
MVESKRRVGFWHSECFAGENEDKTNGKRLYVSYRRYLSIVSLHAIGAESWGLQFKSGTEKVRCGTDARATFLYDS